MVHQRLVLKNAVQIEGFSLLGLPATILLEPAAESGWWFAQDDFPDIELSPDLMRCKSRFLVFDDDARIVEHFFALRFKGLDSVRISFPKKSIFGRSLVPFWGTAMPYLEAIQPSLVPNGSLVSCTPKAMVNASSSTLEKYIYFEPGFTGSLRIVVVIDYPDERIGRDVFEIDITPRSFYGIASSRGLAHLQGLRRFTPMLSVVKWPHRGQWIFPGDMSPEKIRRSLAFHRAVDLLGALASVVPSGAFPEGKIATRLAGHREDVLFCEDIEEIGWDFLGQKLQAA